MPSLTQLKNDAQSARSSSDDAAVRKLATTVEELVKKVKALEAKVQNLEGRV